MNVYTSVFKKGNCINHSLHKQHCSQEQFGEQKESNLTKTISARKGKDWKKKWFGHTARKVYKSSHDYIPKQSGSQPTTQRYQRPKLSSRSRDSDTSKWTQGFTRSIDKPGGIAIHFELSSCRTQSSPSDMRPSRVAIPWQRLKCQVVSN